MSLMLTKGKIIIIYIAWILLIGMMAVKGNSGMGIIAIPLVFFFAVFGTFLSVLLYVTCYCFYRELVKGGIAKQEEEL